MRSVAIATLRLHDGVVKRVRGAIVLLALVGIGACGEERNMHPSDLPQDATGDALRRVIAGGSDLSKPLKIDFQIDVPNRRTGEAVAADSGRAGFAVEIYGDDAEGWTVECSRTMIATHASVSRIEEQLDEIARQHGGRSDGWGTFGNVDE